MKQFTGPALENLSQIESEGPFDLVFIDADKVSYPHYLDWAARNLRSGGAVIADNTFAWDLITKQSGFSDEDESAYVLVLQEFNEKLANLKQFRMTMFPANEGLSVGVKL